MDINVKRSLPVLLAMLVAMTPFSLSTYLPAFPAIADSLGTDITTVQFSLTLYLVGFGLGQLMGGTLSDTYGRRPVALTGVVVFIVSSLLLFNCQTSEQLLAFRFIQALGGGSSTVTAAAIIRDLFNKQDSARMLSMISIMVLTAPLAAPAVGALALKLYGWRSIFLLLSGYSTLLLITLYFLLPETRPRQPEGLKIKRILSSYLSVFTHSRALSFVFTQSFSSGMQFSFLTASPFIYMGYFGISSDTYPILFAANVLAMMLFNRLNVQLLNRWIPEKNLKIGICIQLSANILLFTSTFFQPSLPVVVILVMLAIGSQSMIWPNASACSLAYFPDNSGSATAVIGALRFMMGAIMGSVVSLLHNGTLYPVAFMMLACTTISMICYLNAMRLPETKTLAHIRS
ncbi:hypothetical protein ACH42_04815 [Endozoicomonas sp. (ex Bugula neritina AB1)]|nr:hypothetical protein ACH42_04815 [Endozoicomonas sp. (ex Bugula neritina AB1)]